MNAYSPKGARITGSMEVVEGTALIIPDSFEKGTAHDPEELQFEYEGQTDIDWNSQKTKKDEKKRRLFVDENHEIWSEDQLTLKEE